MSILKAIKKSQERRNKKLYETAKGLFDLCIESPISSESPWVYLHVVEEEQDMNVDRINVAALASKPMSDKWIEKLIEVYNLQTFGRGHNGYQDGDIWIMVDIFYENKYYMYIFNRNGVCIGTSLVTKDENGIQHYDWDKPWFPRQEYSRFYGDSTGINLPMSHLGNLASLLKSPWRGRVCRQR